MNNTGGFMEYNTERDRRLQIMVDRHRTLDIEADELSARSYLLPEEYNRLKQLKLMRLRAKRAIDRFQLKIAEK